MSKLYAGMFRFIIGRFAEDFANQAPSWQDEWQKCEAGIQEYDE